MTAERPEPAGPGGRRDVSIHLLHGAVLRLQAELARYADLPTLAEGTPDGWYGEHDDEHDEVAGGYEANCAENKPPCVPAEPEPVPVEVGDWFKGPFSGKPLFIVRIEDGKVWWRRWEGSRLSGLCGLQPGLQQVGRVATWERCDPPTVEVAARDLRAGMREHGTGRVVATGQHFRPIEVGDRVVAVRPIWKGLELTPWVDPDAVYVIDVDSLPDGWQASGEDG